MNKVYLILPALMSISSTALAEYTVATGYPEPSLNANAVSYSNDLITNTNFDAIQTIESGPDSGDCLAGVTETPDIQQCLESVKIMQTSEGLNIETTNFETRFNTIGDYKAYDLGPTPMPDSMLASFSLFAFLGVIPGHILNGDSEFNELLIPLDDTADFVSSIEFKLQQNRNTSSYVHHIRMGSILVGVDIDRSGSNKITIGAPSQDGNAYTYAPLPTFTTDDIPEGIWLKLSVSYDASNTTITVKLDNLDTMTTIIDVEQSNIYPKLVSTPLILGGSETSQPENPVDNYISDITIRHYNQGNDSIHYTMDYSPLSLGGVDYTDTYFISLAQIDGKNGVAYRRNILNDDSYIPIDVVGTIGNSISAAVIDTGEIEVDGIMQDAEPATAYIYNPNDLSIPEIQLFISQEFGSDAVIDAYYEDILIAQGQGKNFSPSITLPVTPIAELDYIFNNIDVSSPARSRFINKVCNIVDHSQSANTEKVLDNITKATSKLKKLNKKSLIDGDQHMVMSTWLTELHAAATINTQALSEISHDLPDGFCSN